MSFDIKSILEQAKNMQENMQNIKNEIAKKSETGISGGGMVTVIMTGEFYLKNIKISEDLAQQNDLEMTKDLIMAAVNDAINKVKEMNSKEYEKVKGNLPNIPGLNLGF
ncbi:MAG: YbaB/EbfC family nucleoid-associated protein [Candidatus Kapabacteria bacterium]|nr:YbaB/EbfC family nucleoid-associated protein [Candidatus Kapabacteria bacterium]